MATQITAVVNQKGGAGKTTLAMNLAAGLAKRGDTVVVDLDPQGSSLQWSTLGAVPFPATVKQMAGRWDAAALKKQFRAYQHVLLDCPPMIEIEATQMALRASDVVLIPILPSPVDVWSSLRLPAEIAEARKSNARLKAFVVLNQLEPRSALSESMRAALGEFDIPVLNASLRRRAIYRSTALDGMSVYQSGARGAAAVTELEALIEEVFPK